METPQFVVVRPTKTLGAKSLECQVSSLGNLKKFKAPSRWSRAAKASFADHSKKALKDLKASSNDVSLKLNFDSGGEWRGLFISDSIKTYDLHTAMRRAF
ncbi:MAG: hypothetical protein ABL958_13945, partial [Bdellovibrionia bacterium]